jgi:hypothetical protein
VLLTVSVLLLKEGSIGSSRSHGVLRHFKETLETNSFLFDHQRFGAGIHSSIRLSTASINYPSGFAGSSGQIFFANNAYLSGSQTVLLNGGIHEVQSGVQTGS